MIARKELNDIRRSFKLEYEEATYDFVCKQEAQVKQLLIGKEVIFNGFNRLVEKGTKCRIKDARLLKPFVEDWEYHGCRIELDLETHIFTDVFGVNNINVSKCWVLSGVSPSEVESHLYEIA